MPPAGRRKKNDNNHCSLLTKEAHYALLDFRFCSYKFTWIGCGPAGILISSLFFPQHSFLSILHHNKYVYTAELLCSAHSPSPRPSLLLYVSFLVFLLMNAKTISKKCLFNHVTALIFSIKLKVILYRKQLAQIFSLISSHLIWNTFG